MLKKLIVCALLIAPSSYGAPARGTLQLSDLRDGDVIFQTSLSSQSPAIQIATLSRISHVGIIHHVNGKARVLEAIGRVSSTPLKKWIKRGSGGRFVVKRIRNADMILTKKTLRDMFKYGLKQKGKRYDLKFMWSDSKMYCSELVWKIYEKGAGITLSKPGALGDYTWATILPPIKKMAQKRYGGKLPVWEKVVTPADLYASSMLQTVYANY